MNAKGSMLSIILVFFFNIFLSGQDKILNVIPEPQQYQFTSQRFLLDKQVIGIQQLCEDDGPINIIVNELAEVFKSIHNTSAKTNIKSKKQIIIGLPEKNGPFKSICTRLDLTVEEKLGEEGYKLLIARDTIIIAANYQKGLFYGLQTLKQIVRGEKKNTFLPGLRITDYPSLKIRAVMDDISRGPVPTIDFMKYQIKRLAEMKINMFSHYIEHIVKTKSHPEFAPDDGSISIEEWKELSEYASKYNITLVGSFQSFGHFNNVLSTPKYAHLGESGTLISPVLQESYKFLEDIYSEMIPAFKAPFFNINCDETFDLGKGASKNIVDSLGYAEVYFRHIIKLYDIAKKLNSKIMMWGDVLLEHPELLKKLPKDIFIATWTYDDLDSYSKFIDPIVNEGFQFLAVPGVLNSSRLFPLNRQAFGNIKGFISAAVKSNALGAFTTVWDDGGNALFTNDWYGVSYAADKSWNISSGDSLKFDTRFNRAIYRADNNQFTRAVWKLDELADLEPTDGLNDKVLFEKLIPDKGKHIKISLVDWNKVLTITNEANRLIQQSHLNNYSGDIDYLHFVINMYNTLAQERFDLIDAVKCYSAADSIQNVNPKQAKLKIKKASRFIDRIIMRQIKLKSDFEKLWFRENHVYALNRLTDKYQNKIDDFKIVKERLSESLNNLKNKRNLLSKEDARLSITPLPGKYFREWLMTNPIPNKDSLALSKTDYLVQTGGEEKTTPKVTQEFSFDSVKYRWSRVASEYQDIVNLNEWFAKDNKYKVIYAFANIEVKKDTILTALAGVSTGLEVIINGKKIFSTVSDGNITPDQFRFALPLNKGSNNLMLKITGKEKDWSFTFRISDCEVRSRKNRYRIVSE